MSRNIWLLLLVSLHATFGDSHSESRQSLDEPCICPICPTTALPTTALPTTGLPTTSLPTTALPTTALPTTSLPTTSLPTTALPTTALPTPACTSAGWKCQDGPTVNIGAKTTTKYCFDTASGINEISFWKIEGESSNRLKFTVHSANTKTTNEFTLSAQADGYTHGALNEDDLGSVTFIVTNEGETQQPFIVNCHNEND
eukprot:331135_1